MDQTYKLFQPQLDEKELASLQVQARQIVHQSNFIKVRTVFDLLREVELLRRENYALRKAQAQDARPTRGV